MLKTIVTRNYANLLTNLKQDFLVPEAGKTEKMNIFKKPEKNFKN